jgi:hypothetical protein
MFIVDFSPIPENMIPGQHITKSAGESLTAKNDAWMKL